MTGYSAYSRHHIGKHFDYHLNLKKKDYLSPLSPTQGITGQSALTTKLTINTSVGARQQLWVFVRTTFCQETRGKNWSSYWKKNLNPQIIKYINIYTISCHIGWKQVLTASLFLSVPYYNSHLMVVCKVGYLIAVCLIDILINISSWYWAKNIY